MPTFCARWFFYCEWGCPGLQEGQDRERFWIFSFFNFPSRRRRLPQPTKAAGLSSLVSVDFGVAGFSPARA
jgi:hypothetical protein